MQPETDKQPAPLISYRDGRPAWNVKVYRSPTAEECQAVAEELGIDPAALARPPMGPFNVHPPVPFGMVWLENWKRGDPLGFYETLGDVATDGFEHARDYARELFGARADVFQEGRSGGWLVLHHPSVTRAEIDAAEEVLRLAEDGPGNPALEDVTPEELADARELLAKLETFGRYVASAVADHPRAQAWALAQVFQAKAEDYAAELAEEEAAVRLALARTAFEDAATRLCDAASNLLTEEQLDAHPGGNAYTVRDAFGAFDAARLELERAKAEGGAS